MAGKKSAPVKTVHISAKTGQFVPKSYATKHPATTVAMKVPAK